MLLAGVSWLHALKRCASAMPKTHGARNRRRFSERVSHEHDSDFRLPLRARSIPRSILHVDRNKHFWLNFPRLLSFSNNIPGRVRDRHLGQPCLFSAARRRKVCDRNKRKKRRRRKIAENRFRISDSTIGAATAKFSTPRVVSVRVANIGVYGFSALNDGWRQEDRPRKCYAHRRRNNNDFLPLPHIPSPTVGGGAVFGAQSVPVQQPELISWPPNWTRTDHCWPHSVPTSIWIEATQWIVGARKCRWCAYEPAAADVIALDTGHRTLRWTIGATEYVFICFNVTLL